MDKTLLSSIFLILLWFLPANAGLFAQGQNNDSPPAAYRALHAQAAAQLALIQNALPNKNALYSAPETLFGLLTGPLDSLSALIAASAEANPQPLAFFEGYPQSGTSSGPPYLDYAAWLAHTRKVRAGEAKALLAQTVALFRQMSAMVDRQLADSVFREPEFARCRQDWEKLDFFGEAAPSAALFDYYCAKAVMVSLFVAEKKDFFTYRHRQEEQVAYYHKLVSAVSKSRLLLDACIAASQSHGWLVAAQAGMAEARLAQFFAEESDFLGKQEKYCDIRMRDLLTFGQLLEAARPKTLDFEGHALPLAPQPGMVPGDGFVTLAASEGPAGSLFLTGYFQQQQTQEAFVAKINGRRVAWLRKLGHLQKFKGSNTAGVALSVTDGGCLVAAQAYETAYPAYATANALLDLNIAGTLANAVFYEGGHYPLSLLKQQTGYIAVSGNGPVAEGPSLLAYSDPDGDGIFDTPSQTFSPSPGQWADTFGTPVAGSEAAAESLVIRKFDNKGALVWETGLGFYGDLAGIIPQADGYLVACNVYTPSESSPDERQLYLVKLDRAGRTVARKKVSATVPHFATCLVGLENGSALALGFEGGYLPLAESHTSTGRVMSLLVDSALNILESSL